MCGRFTLTMERLEDVAEALQGFVAAEWLKTYRPRFNVAPGQSHWLLRSGLGRRELVPAHWGLINTWAKDPAVGFKQINARAETLAQRPAFRVAFKQRRCVVPTDGFYEWHGPAKARQPFWFHPPGGGLLLLAGLYEDWTPPGAGEARTTFTIVTTAATEPVVQVHSRMPAILSREQVDAWLVGPNPAELLQALPHNAVVARAVSPRVNSAKYDDPACVEPDQRGQTASAAGSPRQGKLF
jgi:putative SOS response-associated peptidase YedK